MKEIEVILICKIFSLSLSLSDWMVTYFCASVVRYILRGRYPNNFSLSDDKKELGAARRSQYYMKYGNPNYGGMKGILSNSW